MEFRKIPQQLKNTLQQQQTIYHLIAAWTKRNPEAIAITAPLRIPLTYSCLQTYITENVATLNAMGLGRSDRVAIVLPNSPEMAMAFLAVAACATSAPLNPAYQASDFEFYLRDLKVKAVVILSGMDSPARAVAQAHNIPVIELVPVESAAAGIFKLTGNLDVPAVSTGIAQPDDVALVLHTSGTTSRPKIVPLTHRNLCTSADNIKATLELEESDRCLNVMPLFHIHGLVAAVLASLSAGASVACAPGFDSTRFFTWMDELRPTWYTAVPTIHQAILSAAQQHDEIISRRGLRFIRSSSAALPVQLMAALEQTFNVPVIEAYGMTEAAHQMASNPLPPHPRKPGSVGIPAGSEVAVMDEAGNLLSGCEVGEIVIRGLNVTQGYENNLQANQMAFTNGWFRTGDQGYLDSDGYLFLTGRLKEIINRGGEKISPREVDEVLMAHPAVAVVVAFAIPHPTLGEDVAAAVVLQPQKTATEQELREFASQRLTEFKVPSQIVFLDEIPKGPTGKLQRIGLAEKLANKLQPAFVAPQTEVEKILADIWTEVLRVKQVGIYDNFFALGGDSLQATSVISRIREAFSMELSLGQLFAAPTIASLSKVIETARQARAEEQSGSSTVFNPLPPLVPVPRDTPIPLYLSQRSIWLIQQRYFDSCAYNNSIVLRLTGKLFPEVLEKSINEIIRRHEILRTTFTQLSDKPLQVIAESLTLPLKIINLKDLPPQEREAEVKRLSALENQHHFDLVSGPLIKTTLLQLVQEEHWLLITMHHIITDAWSVGILLEELGTLYNAFSTGRVSPLPELPCQYADFTLWHLKRLNKEVVRQQLSYWHQKLTDIPLPLDLLPVEQPQQSSNSRRSSFYSIVLPESMVASIQALSRSQGVTLFAIILTALKILLFKESGQADIVVLATTANRIMPATEKMIGCFANGVFLRSHADDSQTGLTFLEQVKQTVSEAVENQEIPVQKVGKTIRGLELISTVSINMHPPVQCNREFLNCEIVTLPDERDFLGDQTPLRFFVDSPSKNNKTIKIQGEYRTGSFTNETLERLFSDYQEILKKLVSQPETILGKF
ncbi:MAG: AMP-binding protein [Stigonema ocellatum SAG 48.90 = DSM 106950]|nr:AMP-binding protein [Stigonema ocellatum SAG 48.90 = DSM 106950]